MLAPETGSKVSPIDSVHFRDPTPTNPSVNLVRPHANVYIVY